MRAVRSTGTDISTAARIGTAVAVVALASALAAPAHAYPVPAASSIHCKARVDVGHPYSTYVWASSERPFDRASCLSYRVGARYFNRWTYAKSTVWSRTCASTTSCFGSTWSALACYHAQFRQVEAHPDYYGYSSNLGNVHWGCH